MQLDGRATTVRCSASTDFPWSTVRAARSDASSAVPGAEPPTSLPYPVSWPS